MTLGSSPGGVYNPDVVEHRHLPDAEKLSILAALILLAYALARFINVPVNDIEIQLPGMFINFQLNVRTIVAFLVAGITAAGADWLLKSHPRIEGHHTIEHWILPGITAWVIGLPIFQLPPGLSWWLWFFIGGTLLILVMVAEYITIDPDDIRQPIAAAGLTAVAYALLLVLSITVKDAGVRLYMLLSAVVLAVGAISLRTLHLRLHGRWAFLFSLVIVIIVAQITAAIHYLPISPVSFGLILMGLAYGLTGVIANLANGVSLNRAVVEPGSVFIIILITVIWLR